MEEVKALKIIQNEQEMLIFGMPADILMKIAYFNPREKDRESGIQRGYNKGRSKAIADYIDNDDNAVLSNNIIINLNLRELNLSINDVYDEKSKLLNIKKIMDKSNKLRDCPQELKGKIAFVIDGQHRLRAFEFAEKKSFNLIITALIDLSLAEVAEIFVKINYYQTPVNKSLALDLLGISENIFPKYYKLYKIINRLNDEIGSPFYGKVKMLGMGKGFVSQASFITAIEKYNLEKTLLKIGVNIDDLYDILWNYFTMISKVFNEFWGEKKFLSKTIGIRAFIKLLGDILIHFNKKSLEFSSDELQKHFSKIKKETIKTLSEESLGGEKGVNSLYDKLKNELNII
ncbi:MAG TPA: DGQHR domain-containing protein [Spirochaetota bacterium]|nr:DGQHR domain-containing protein [Spirochaetota bacterium]HPN29494.1 DGQHR domain-containing protein [bacterium]HPN29515.1 DGQHR domain-containing protein [bacterium]